MTTRLTTLLSSCVFLAIAACGDDGGNNNNDDTCGDGQRTGAEQCDDGNTTGGDGCSAQCRNESSGPVCGDGVVSSPETCDDSNTTSGDGCSATCQQEQTADCGNGQLDANEDCDDNNATPNDGCTACNVDAGWTCNNAEPSVCTMVTQATGACTAPFTVTLAANGDGDLEGHAIGDTTSASNMFATGDCNGGDVGGGNDHTYTFTLATAADVLITGPETPAFDMAIRLTTAACTQATMVPDDAGGDGCSDDDPEFLQYINLPAGTYYLTVDGYDNTEAGAYDVTIVAFAMSTCGNGIVDLGEECDDNDVMAGDGCDARCDVEPGYVCTEADANSPSVCVESCGNGTFESDLEECEYVVGVTDDVCTAQCTLISDVLEVEPNNTVPQSIGAGNHRRVRGALPANDVDLFTFTLTEPSIVEIETYNAADTDDTNYLGVGDIANIDCLLSLDTTLGLFPNGADYTMDAMAIAVDDDDGDVACSYLGFNDSGENVLEGVLEPGTYVIRVKEFSDPAERYILDVFITPATAATTGDLVINEYMGDDGAADTNCDGVNGTGADTDDEFIELVNVSGEYLSINGVRIHDASATPLRHTFAAGPTGYVGLLPGESVVVWGGGAPACADVLSFFESSQGSLALNNTGDSIIVLPPVSTTPIVQTVFTQAQLVTGVSNNLSPDVTGTAYVRHNLVAGAVGNFSPGTLSDETSF